MVNTYLVFSDYLCTPKTLSKEIVFNIWHDAINRKMNKDIY